uniref:Uncharacterized protein n=1 Tax=Kalanchoe fedtschenkoi TaxID=63787 RepID=A0A7N0RBK6_KALFE
MATNRKLKKVSWAPDGNLSQIRQFSSEDCPSKVGLRIDRTHMKPSNRSQFSFASKELSLGLCRTKIKEAEKSSSIPIIRWKCPPKINLDPSWLFASGEQSTEVDAQKHRELKVFEAVYPRPTDIPHSPTGALCKDGYLPDDGITPIVRITPIEDDDAPLDSSDLGTSLSSGGPTLPVVSDCPPLGILNTCQRVDAVQTPQLGETQVVNSCAEADVAAAASAALTALLKSSEMGSSIDTNMLIEILNNPETVSMLLNGLSSSSTAEPSPKTTSDQVSSSVLFSPPSSDVYSSASASGKWGGAPMSALCAPTTLKPSYVTDRMLSPKTVTIPPGSLGGPLMTHSPVPSVGKGSQFNLIHKVPSPTTINQMRPYVSYGAGTPLTTKATRTFMVNYHIHKKPVMEVPILIMD